MDRIKDMMQRADFFLLTVGVITLARWTFADEKEIVEDDDNVENEVNTKEVDKHKKRIEELEEEVRLLKAQLSQQTSFNTDANRCSSLNVKYYPTPMSSKRLQKSDAKVLFSAQSISSKNGDQKEGSPSSVCDTPESVPGVTTPLVVSRPAYTPASNTSSVMTAGREECIQVAENSTPTLMQVTATPSPYVASALANLPKRTADSPVLKTEDDRVMFCKSVISKVDPSNEITQCLIVVMTRDLARKVYSVIEPLTREASNEGLTAELIIPGFKKASKTCVANVVIGTPDMIEKEIYKRNYLHISELKDLVFDEAYDLIKLDVVIGMTPTKKQVLRIQEAAPQTVKVVVASF